MRILITGAFGFIGSYLTKNFIDEGHEIVIATNRVHNFPYIFSKCIIKIIDWECESDLLKVTENVDIVIHAAGADANFCKNNPTLAIKINAIYTGYLAKASSVNKIKLFIYFSTIHVYSEILRGEINENTYTKNTTPYAISKICAENLLKNYNKENNLRILVIRLSNTFGLPISPKINCWDGVVNNFCFQAAVKNEIRLKSSGEEIRNFISINQVFNFIKTLLYNSDYNSFPEIFNLGSTTNISVYQLAKKVVQNSELILQKKINIICEKKASIKYQNLDYKTIFNNKFGSQADPKLDENITELLLGCIKWFKD